MDPRLKDSIRNTEKVIKELAEKVDKIVNNQTEILKIVRAIKRSTVRGYKKPGVVEKILGKKDDGGPHPVNNGGEDGSS